jgi:hypothetical protein
VHELWHNLLTFPCPSWGELSLRIVRDRSFKYTSDAFHRSGYTSKLQAILLGTPSERLTPVRKRYRNPKGPCHFSRENYPYGLRVAMFCGLSSISVSANHTLKTTSSQTLSIIPRHLSTSLLAPLLHTRVQARTSNRLDDALSLAARALRIT